jgi:hypothetical protein
MNSPPLIFRDLAAHERSVIRRILGGDPRGAEFEEQIEHKRVAPLDNNGSLAFEPGVIAQGGRVQKFAAEGQLIDRDGIAVHVLLFRRGDELFELQVYKDDGSPILRAVEGDPLELLLL